MSTRLPGTKYKSVFDRGRSIRGRLVVGWYRAADDAVQEAGVVVSKKTFHDAVDRNRAKRLMREAYRLMVREGTVPERVEWIFIARGNMRGKKVADVKADIAALCARLPGDALAHDGRGVPV